MKNEVHQEGEDYQEGDYQEEDYQEGDCEETGSKSRDTLRVCVSESVKVRFKKW